MRPIILNGPPASGKSTIGKALAEKLGRKFLDTDRMIEIKAGKKIPQIFTEKGESHFRGLERDIVEKVLKEKDAVIAVGGGALVNDHIRRRALKEAFVFSFKVPIEVLKERADIDMEKRPLQRLLERRLALREGGYHEAHRVFEAVHSVEELVAEIEQAILILHDDVVMPLGTRTYLVKVESVDNLRNEIQGHAPSKTVAIIDKHVEDRVPKTSKISQHILLPGEGDQNKNLNQVSEIWDECLQAGIDRDSLLVGIGGGVTTDLTGFAASTLLRGIRYISVPTTLLSMIDASVGGKTGFDHAAGKNLIGTFHQPSAVICDPKFLHTLPKEEVLSGLAEIVKIALISGEELLDNIDTERMALRELDLDVITSLIPKAIQEKVDIVCEDESESKRGVRELLNFGHTAGHAMESLLGYSTPHGLCVAQGIRVALAIGEKLAVTSSSKREWVETLLGDIGFPILGNELQPEAIIEAMKKDKKRKSGAHRFVLMQNLGEGCVQVVDESVIKDVLKGMKI